MAGLSYRKRRLFPNRVMIVGLTKAGKLKGPTKLAPKLLRHHDYPSRNVDFGDERSWS